MGESRNSSRRRCLVAQLRDGDRESLASVLAGAVHVCSCAEPCEPDSSLLLVDADLLSASELPRLEGLRTRFPNAEIVLVAQERLEEAIAALRHGARDVVLRREGWQKVVGERLDSWFEQKPLAYERPLVAAFQASSEAILVLDKRLSVRMANPAAETLLGVPSGGLRLRRFEPFLPGASRTALSETLEALSRSQETSKPLGTDAEFRLLRSDGIEVRVEGSVTRSQVGPDVGWALALRDATSSRADQEQARRAIARIEALREIELAIAGSLDLRLTLRLLLDHLTRNLHVDAATILLGRPDSNVLHLAADRGFRTARPDAVRLRMDEGLVGQALLHRKAQGSWDPTGANHCRSRAELARAEGFKGYFAVPLIAKNQVKGAMELFFRKYAPPSEEWLSFLQMLASQAAVALENAAMYEEVQRANVELRIAYDKTIDSWVRMIDLRDHETEGHSQRTTELTMRLADQMGFGEEEMLHIRRGALLHDIGKLGIPDGILLKPGPLDRDERARMQTHTVLAYRMLAGIDFLRPALDIPYCHHERWDGSGYPRGLDGHEIPLAARIFAVVDVWDALRSDRPYRKGWEDTDVVNYIRNEAGGHFDPEIVERFLDFVAV